MKTNSFTMHRVWRTFLACFVCGFLWTCFLESAQAQILLIDSRAAENAYLIGLGQQADETPSGWYSGLGDQMKSAWSNTVSSVQQGVTNLGKMAENLAHQTVNEVGKLSDATHQAAINLAQWEIDLVKWTKNNVVQPTIQTAENIAQATANLGVQAVNNVIQWSEELALWTDNTIIKPFSDHTDIQDPCEAWRLSVFSDASYTPDGDEYDYKDEDGKQITHNIPSGWSVVTNISSGYHGKMASLYSDGKKCVLAFTGTSSNLDTVNADIGNVIGVTATPDNVAFGTTPRYVEALKIASAAKANAYSQCAELELTGHSLGGGEAAYAGALLGLPATTFNAADLGLISGLNANLTGLFNSASIINYRNVVDPLSTVGNSLTSVYGTMGVGQDAWMVGAGPNFWQTLGHGIQPIRDRLYEQGGRKCDKNEGTGSGGAATTQSSTGQATGTTGTGTGGTILPSTDSSNIGNQGNGTQNSTDSSIGQPGKIMPRSAKRIDEQYGE